VATEIEAQTVRWIAELIGYPTDAGGLFVSGGNMANIVGLLAARAAAADWDVRAPGSGHPTRARCGLRLVRDAHLDPEGADLSGLGTDAIRWIPTDAELRMDTGALREALIRDREAGSSR
jgi:aromatic-L-amino-acid/L-tryptophan decarboxylase